MRRLLAQFYTNAILTRGFTGSDCLVSVGLHRTCGIFATQRTFFAAAIVRNRFSAPLSRNDNMRGPAVSYSTFLVLLLLTFGQVFILGMGFFVFWLVGEFEDGSGRTRSVYRLRRRWTLRTQLSARRFLRRLRRAVAIGGRLSYPRLMVTSFFVAVAVASILLMTKASIERSKTASVPLPGPTDGLNRTPR
jgi:hypothetical protein